MEGFCSLVPILVIYLQERACKFRCGETKAIFLATCVRFVGDVATASMAHHLCRY